jgi:hypothetical protein
LFLRIPTSQLFSADRPAKLLPPLSAASLERSEESFLDGVLGFGGVAEAGHGVPEKVIAVKLHPLVGVGQAGRRFGPLPRQGLARGRIIIAIHGQNLVVHTEKAISCRVETLRFPL